MSAELPAVAGAGTRAFCRDCLADLDTPARRCSQCGSPRLVRHRALASLALGPSAPTGVELENLRLENNSTLRWNANPEPDVAGYRILWRDTTSPTWQQVKDVGNVTRETLVGVSKDNVVFGVQAYNRDGQASIAVYPKPYRPVTR